jgi:hypothetical protein
VFEKLLSLLLHAKGGAVASVFVLGTTGALVTATVDAGVTTITITQPSSTTGSETTPDGTTTNTTVTDTILALFTRTNGDEDPTATATGKGCSDEAHVRNDAMKDVNKASTSHRQEITGLDRDADASEAKQLVKDADKDLRGIRQAAVKAIHATFDCDPNEDEQQDEDDVDQDEDNTSTTTDPSVAFGGDNAEAIADLAILAMDQVVADLKAALEGLENSDETTTADEKQNGKSENAKNENKGKGNDNKGKGSGKGRSGGDEDDD